MTHPFAVVKVDDLKDMLTKRATIERLSGDIAKSSHTLMIRNMILRAVKKSQKQPQTHTQPAQSATKAIA